MDTSKSIIKKASESDKELDIYEYISEAAVEGGNAMAANEPFGPLIGAAIGAVEEGMSLLSARKTKKD